MNPKQTPEENDHHIRELKQKINILLELENDFSDKVYDLQESNKQLKEKLDSKSSSSKELGQENLFLKEMKNLHTDNSEELEVTIQNLKDVMDEKNRMARELEQQKLIMNGIDQTMTNKISELEESNKDLKEKLNQKSLSSKETEQEKVFLDEMSKNEIAKTQAISKKYYLTIAVAGIVLAGVIVPYSLYVVTLVGEEYRVQTVGPVTTGYVIQNLRGDTIDTWIAWRVPDDEVIRITVSGSALTPERLEIVKQVFLDTEPMEIDNSLLHKGPKGTTSIHYAGWTGALLAAAETPTQFALPVNFEITDKGGIGDINIKLENALNPDGFSGWTSSIVDEVNNQILKSDITIYQTSDYSDNQFAAILRHEVGHALGLAHSTAPEDLMSPTLTTDFPFISECDINAITSLYDNGKSSRVVCEI